MERELWWFVPKRVWQAEIWESKPIFFSGLSNIVDTLDKLLAPIHPSFSLPIWSLEAWGSLEAQGIPSKDVHVALLASGQEVRVRADAWSCPRLSGCDGMCWAGNCLVSQGLEVKWAMSGYLEWAVLIHRKINWNQIFIIQSTRNRTSVIKKKKNPTN